MRTNVWGDKKDDKLTKQRGMNEMRESLWWSDELSSKTVAHSAWTLNVFAPLECMNEYFRARSLKRVV